ncbi:MAG: tyrosine-protein phosphatase [Acidimicrobiales bacterium]|nr:tyrosine-protein phosphatase [Acidimicrobiales bacterium]
MNPRERLVPLAGAFNFRDLGGYRSSSGRATRWGRLYRSDTLHDLTDADVELLRSLGLATIVDLRTRRELAATGRGMLESEPIAFRHLSVITEGDGEVMGAPTAPGEELGERYLWYLDGGRQALVDALTLVAEPANLPLVFHCAAGKDRTGVLAALVLDIVGVDPDLIVADYVITADRMELILGRYRDDPAVAERMARVPAYRFEVQAQSMQRFLTGLHDRFGGGRAWAVAAGVPPESVDRLPDLLLEPPA